MKMTRPQIPAGLYSKSHGTTGSPAGSVASRTRYHPQPLSQGSPPWIPPPCLRLQSFMVGDGEGWGG